MAMMEEFQIVRLMNRLRNQGPEPAKKPATQGDILLLLREIRDNLKK